MTAPILGVIVGLILGLTGAGGSVIAVPLLMWGMHWNLAQAAPTALLAVSAAAALGTFGAWRQGIVRYRAAFVMSISGLCLAPVGIWLGNALSNDILIALFACVLVIVAVRILKSARTSPEEANIVRAGLRHQQENPEDPVCTMSPLTGQLRWTRPCALAITASGMVTGLLSGMLGVGGGFVIVPALRAVTDLSFHSAVATSLMAIAITSAGTVTIAWMQGVHLPWAISAPFMGGAIAGMLLGRTLADRIAGPTLQSGFAIVMLGISIALLTGTFM